MDKLKPRKFGLHLRIPAWCKNYAYRMNGEAQDQGQVENGYAVLRRQWQTCDVIELTLDMPVQRIVGHPFSGAIRERIAIQRGPVIYCLEGVDNPISHDPLLPADAKFQATRWRDFLGGVVTITVDDVDGHPLTATPTSPGITVPAQTPSKTG
ncbi:MAG: hypothetical protein ABI700_04510 [Chloroflexota bacterium]